jgi:hypothetical protein
MQRFGLLALILALGIVWAAPMVSAQRNGPGNHRHERHPARTGRPHGDALVRTGLIAATADLTSQRPRQVREQLKRGLSIEQIVRAAGKSAADVLARFDTDVDRRMQRAVGNQRFPQSVATARAAWFKQAARLQLDQPGMSPAFPGLHEVHVMMISAAVRSSGMPRSEIRAQLESCKTLAESVATKGRSGADVVNTMLATANQTLQQWASNGKLTTAQHDEWSAALQAAANTMVNTPGLHVAGKECAR